MLDVLSGCYEESSKRRIFDSVSEPYNSTWHNLNFDILSSDLGMYLGYYGFLRQNIYTMNDQVVGHQYYKNQADSFVWQKIVLSPWESFVFRLYGFYKNQIGLSYYYGNLSQDVNSLLKGIQVVPQLKSIWSSSTSVGDYLQNLRHFKYYNSFSDDSNSIFVSSWNVYAGNSGLSLGGAFFNNDGELSGVPIFTQARVDDFFRSVYDYKPLVLGEPVQLVNRELYYWGNSWCFKNSGGVKDFQLGFLSLDSYSYQVKYNKSSKLVKYVFFG